ncbi:uncharacterized protein MONOS_9387 [Monocercomonoides exilis]|uniref:uncharacterized protein n=1 Tax=Monocercomonoides exilis TaxID=2049356 RepID=UPI003559A33E|nr:hypothetical protein MONOS_9387 [Monocercomonoides exilis]|eukprot:MONOS_9387.1-p1 / transcript=MONOS_9387.1 / gene=MONOS_9387 / organism=Monocercomonoides_exilis_PA203 / gene_product=unspecified product / transcript_product=unspecified product / location=Mono_scaffold00386:37214-38986(+) / protein_length=535 / sequence_SO=supercontig / SO=protein_coding / is_pseudo=false
MEPEIENKKTQIHDFEKDIKQAPCSLPDVKPIRRLSIGPKYFFVYLNSLSSFKSRFQKILVSLMISCVKKMDFDDLDRRFRKEHFDSIDTMLTTKKLKLRVVLPLLIQIGKQFVICDFWKQHDHPFHESKLCKTLEQLILAQKNRKTRTTPRVHRHDVFLLYAAYHLLNPCWATFPNDFLSRTVPQLICKFKQVLKKDRTGDVAEPFIMAIGQIKEWGTYKVLKSTKIISELFEISKCPELQVHAYSTSRYVVWRTLHELHNSYDSATKKEVSQLKIPSIFASAIERLRKEKQSIEEKNRRLQSVSASKSKKVEVSFSERKVEWTIIGQIQLLESMIREDSAFAHSLCMSSSALRQFCQTTSTVSNHLEPTQRFYGARLIASCFEKGSLEDLKAMADAGCVAFVVRKVCGEEVVRVNETVDMMEDDDEVLSQCMHAVKCLVGRVGRIDGVRRQDNQNWLKKTFAYVQKLKQRILKSSQGVDVCEELQRQVVDAIEGEGMIDMCYAFTYATGEQPWHRSRCEESSDIIRIIDTRS